MTTKGHRANPYTYEEYYAISKRLSWRGGWVKKETTQIKYYITITHQCFTTHLGEYNLGTINNPFNYDLYKEMQSNSTWSGGWVYPGTQRDELNEISYISENKTIYGLSSNIGDKNNPYTSAIYYEMYNNEIWLGGWVKYDNGDTMYINSMYNDGETGCGCGCSSGSGTSSGSGSASGCGHSGNVLPGFAYIHFPKYVVVYLSWEYGPARPGGASVSAKVTSDHNGIVKAEWKGNYLILITYMEQESMYYIPEIFWE